MNLDIEIIYSLLCDFHRWIWLGAYFSNIIGITNEYTRGDKIIAWSVFLYSFGLGFCVFLGVIIWNFFQPWPQEWWSDYFLIILLVIPGIAAIITTFWFFIGGLIDLKRMFRDLNARTVDDLDNGIVVGNVSLSDKKQFEKLGSVENGQDSPNKE